MPKGIGYGEASKMGFFGRLRKQKNTDETEKVVKALIKSGLTEKEARARVDKPKKKGKR